MFWYRYIRIEINLSSDFRYKSSGRPVTKINATFKQSLVWSLTSLIGYCPVHILFYYHHCMKPMNWQLSNAATDLLPRCITFLSLLVGIQVEQKLVTGFFCLQEDKSTTTGCCVQILHMCPYFKTRKALGSKIS